MIHPDAYLTFMDIPVHIAIDDKINITGFFHPHDLNAVFLKIFPFIQFSVPETEYLSSFIGASIIGPKLASLNDRHNICIFVGLILYRLIHNPQINTITGQFCMLSVIQFFRLPFKIQKPHSGLIVPHPIKIGYIVIIRLLLFLRIRKYIRHGNTAGCLIHILNNRNSFLLQFHFHLSPGHPLKAGMDIQRSICAVCLRGIRFQIRS